MRACTAILSPNTTFKISGTLSFSERLHSIRQIPRVCAITEPPILRIPHYVL